LTIEIVRVPTDGDPHIASLGPAQLFETSLECLKTGLTLWRVSVRFMSSPMRCVYSTCCARRELHFDRGC